MAELTQEPSSTATTDGASEGYRPLSLLALVGFVLALSFAGSVLVGGLAAFAARYPSYLVVLSVVAVVGGWLAGLALKRNLLGTIGLVLAGLATLLGLGSLVAFSGTSPWLLDWSFGLLVAAALLTCWLARSRIAASEGTLGGSALAGWGIGLTVFFALNYSAYYLSSVYAVRSQGRQAADEFVELLRQGKVLDAFVRTKRARERPSGADIRRTVELESKASNGPAGGTYSDFLNHTLVRMFENFGEDAVYEKIGISEVYEKEVYEVKVTYRATTKMGVADFDLFAIGEGSLDGATVRRQWHIETRGGSQEMRKSLAETDEGLGFFMAVSATRPLASQWLKNLTFRNLDEAYLITIPPEKRRAQADSRVLRQNAVLSLTGLALGGGLQASASGLESFQRGFESFQRGSLLDVEDLYPPKGSASDEKVRQEIIARIKTLFVGEAGNETKIDMAQMAEVPSYHRTGDTIAISYPVQMRSRGKSRNIEGELEIVGPWTKELLLPIRYQIRRLRLYRGPESNTESSQGAR